MKSTKEIKEARASTKQRVVRKSSLKREMKDHGFKIGDEGYEWIDFVVRRHLIPTIIKLAHDQNKKTIKRKDLYTDLIYNANIFKNGSEKLELMKSLFEKAALDELEKIKKKVEKIEKKEETKKIIEEELGLPMRDERIYGEK